LFLFCLSALFIGIGMLCAQGSARFSDDANNALNIMTALPYFLLVLIGMFVCYRTFSPLLKGTKNENRIYSFQ
jgi:integral membrane sensor domain MASE1